MNQIETAVNHFSAGKNCAQSVLIAFSDELNLDQEQARKLTLGFAGGIALNGKVCGAVAGAIMVLGMKYSAIEEDPAKAKELTFKKVNEFLSAFKEKYDSIDCRDLLNGIDLMTPEGRAESTKQNTHDNICSAVVGKAAEIILEL